MPAAESLNSAPVAASVGPAGRAHREPRGPRPVGQLLPAAPAPGASRLRTAIVTALGRDVGSHCLAVTRTGRKVILTVPSAELAKVVSSLADVVVHAAASVEPALSTARLEVRVDGTASPQHVAVAPGRSSRVTPTPSPAMQIAVARVRDAELRERLVEWMTWATVGATK